jgi:hypothetical protein
MDENKKEIIFGVTMLLIGFVGGCLLTYMYYVGW